MREVVDGDREGNYGIFNLNLNKPEISVHLEKDMTQVDLPILIEIASQQVATVLNEESKTLVFKSIRVINPSENILSIGVWLLDLIVILG